MTDIRWREQESRGSNVSTGDSLSMLLLFAATTAAARSAPVVTRDERVDKLLSRMTLPEKPALFHGTQEESATYQGQAGYLAGIPRLGIPACASLTPVLTHLPTKEEPASIGAAATVSVKDAELNGVVDRP